MKRNIYTRQDVGNVFLICVGAPQVVATFFVVLLIMLSSSLKIDYEALTNNPIILTIMAGLSQFLFCAIFFIYNKICKVNSANACNLNKINWPNILISIIIGLICLFGFNNLVNSFSSLVQYLGHEPSSMPLPLTNIWWLIINIILLGILPAIFEELLFRGIILNGLKQYGKVKAVIFSALLFALLHGSIDQTLYPIILGIVLAVVALKTNSVIPSILIHFVNNTIVIIINYIYTASNTVIQPTVDLKYVLISIAIAIISSVAIFGLTKLLKPSKSKVTLQENDILYLESTKTKSNTMLWFGVVLGIIVWIANLFV